MNIISDVLDRLHALIFRAREEREMDEEIRFHLEMEAEQHRRLGLDEEEAHRRGLVAFGGVERIKEDVRDARGTRLVEDAAGDIRWSLRTLRRSPRFTIVAVLTLAIGIGGTTAVFSAVDAVLLKPLPYAQPGQLVRLYSSFAGHPDEHSFVTAVHFRAYQHHLASLAAVAAMYTYSETGANIGGRDGTERIRLLPITASYFDVLRARPVIGHVFEPRDEDGAPLVILSHDLWEREFAGNPAAIGRAFTMDGVPHTVVGVMPAGFADPVAGAVDAWVPIDLGPTPDLGPDNYFLTVLARLAPDMTLSRAQAELDALGVSLAKEYPTAKDTRAVLIPLKDDVVGPSSRALELMLGAVGLVLLLVGVNIANLMLVRGSERAREFALRSALGAARARLVQQLLIESLTLSLAGAIVGLVVAMFAMKLLVALGADNAMIRRMVLRHGLTLTALGVAVGLLSALAASRLLASLVFRVSPLEPRVLIAAALLMAVVAALAAYLPARRTTRLDPRLVIQGE